VADHRLRLAVSDNEVERFRASGWHVLEIDGHDTDEIRQAIAALHTPLTTRLQQSQPWLVLGASSVKSTGCHSGATPTRVDGY